MINVEQILDGYDLQNISVGVLGGHSALDVSQGAHEFGMKSIVVAQKGREQTYKRFMLQETGAEYERGCVDDVQVLDQFQDVLQEQVQEYLRSQNTLFMHNRYFWVYFDEFRKVETEFNVPILGSRTLLKLEERDQAYNQYHLLEDAGIRTPKFFKNPKDIDRLCIVKAAEAHREFERAFFLVSSAEEYESVGTQMEKEGRIQSNWREAIIEEFIVGAPVNFNYFYSPITGQLELVGTDTRRQTNLDGFLRLTADQQQKALKHIEPKMIETGHIACTVKESLIEKAIDIGERFVKATQNLPKDLDPSGKGIIGPFALQGAIVTDEGKEDVVVFDVSLRIPGSPGISATPYSNYLYGRPLSMGQRIAMEIKHALEENRLPEILT